VYTHDFADREATLVYEQSGGSQPPAVVSSATHESFGPLSSLTLGNGLTETRLFDARYFPAGIQVPGRLDWDYTVDAVGNPLQIVDLLTPAQSRTYGYQDPQYFLAQGDGPWGMRSWTYDRIGNRLTETRGALTDTYGYPGGNPKLQTVTLAGGAGTRYFGYDAAGNQIQDSRPDNEYQLTYDAAGRLTRLGEIATDASTRLIYDGRGFLRESRQDLSVCAPLLTQATYTSDGVLVHRAQGNALAPAAPPLDEAYIFYFAGRPVAILKGNVPATLTRTYLTVDHLGTPVLATSAAGVTVWSGGFEPFGADWSGAQGAGVFLRFPGQWEDASWAGGGLESGLYYNVHRWYGTGMGRYVQPDPVDKVSAAYVTLLIVGTDNPYGYALQQPLKFVDPLGLRADDPAGCVTHWVAAGTAVGAGIGAVAGGTAGAVGGGALCTPVAPGFGTLGCGAAGAAGGSTAGAAQGGFFGATAGAIVGTLVCTCDLSLPRIFRRDKPTDEIDCRKIKQLCIEKCTAATLPTGTFDGAPFFRCLRQCLDSFGC
jgi:RHS repeat-associated protein